ncbi:MAG: cell division protein FtsQ [Moraxellaceae bacterium]|jgi:cell division protein FtsQ|nr:cell division protein FtsQ [Moraxellaceae bacterium]
MLQATRRPIAAVEAAMPKFRFGMAARAGSLVLLVLAAVTLGVVLVRVGGFLQERAALRVVQVEGELRRADRRLIAGRVAPVAQGNYFNADLAAIKAAAESAPWVDSVVVSRRWPDGIRLQVREKQPVALWGAGGLISSRGDLFVPPEASVQSVDSGSLPILFGPGDKGTYVMEQYRAMNGILRLLGMRIVELQLTDRMSWFLRLDNGIHLVVDQVDTIEKLQRFAYLYEKQLRPDADNIASIDLRYRNGVAVGWKTPRQALPKV